MYLVRLSHAEQILKFSPKTVAGNRLLSVFLGTSHQKKYLPRKKPTANKKDWSERVDFFYVWRESHEQHCRGQSDCKVTSVLWRLIGCCCLVKVPQETINALVNARKVRHVIRVAIKKMPPRLIILLPIGFSSYNLLPKFFFLYYSLEIALYRIIKKKPMQCEPCQSCCLIVRDRPDATKSSTLFLRAHVLWTGMCTVCMRSRPNNNAHRWGKKGARPPPTRLAQIDAPRSCCRFPQNKTKRRRKKLPKRSWLMDAKLSLFKFEKDIFPFCFPFPPKIALT